MFCLNITLVAIKNDSNEVSVKWQHFIFGECPALHMNEQDMVAGMCINNFFIKDLLVINASVLNKLKSTC